MLNECAEAMEQYERALESAHHYIFFARNYGDSFTENNQDTAIKILKEIEQALGYQP